MHVFIKSSSYNIILNKKAHTSDNCHDECALYAIFIKYTCPYDFYFFVLIMSNR